MLISVQRLLPHGKFRGFTLLEMLVTLTVLGVLTAMAVPSFNSFIANQKIKTIAYDMVSSFVGARSEAMKRNASVVMAPANGTSWQSGWTIVTGGTTLTQHAAITGLTVSCKSGGASVANCPSVTYNGYGRISAAGSPTIQVTGAGSSYVRCITIDLSGRPSASKTACP